MSDKKMVGLIVFNSANDVVYQKLNDALTQKVHDVACAQGLLPQRELPAANKAAQSSASTTPGSQHGTIVDTNILLQIFSPLINSQRIMLCQFDNTYYTFQCENGFNLAFGELLGYSFVKIGQRAVADLKRHLGVAIALTRYFYGANLFAAQANSMQEELLTNCLTCYEEQLWDEEQAIMLEALPRLLVNSELKRVVHATLDAALVQLQHYGHQRAHALLFVANKFVGIRSSKHALALAPADLVFLQILTRALYMSKETTARARRAQNRAVAVFLQGVAHDPHSGCVPCIAHISHLDKHNVLIQIIEYANLQVASSMYDAFFVLQKITAVQMQGDSDALKPAYENLETFVRQTLDALKRHLKVTATKCDEIDAAIKKFAAKWENLRKMYAEYFKSGYEERELLVRIESNVPAFIEELKLLFNMSCCDSSSIQLDQLPEVAANVEGKLLEITEFLAVKAARNISIDAYLEDFPGLVHFMFINRSTGQMIAPDLRHNQVVPKQQLWSMVAFTRDYLKQGQTTVMWKDKTFHYSYFLWFEDQANSALKPLDLQQNFLANAIGSANASNIKPHFEPGTLALDYYQQLIELCFPKATPGKVKCFELYCIHLGLVTATCAVEHARRLVATIVDVVGEEDNF